MSMSKRILNNSLIDAIILILIYVAVASFPFNLFIKNNDALVIGCSTILLIFYLIFLLFYLIKGKSVKINKRNINIKMLLLFLPCLIATVSNYFYTIGKNLTFSFNNMFFVLFSSLIISVMIEELLYRGVLFEQFKNQKPLVRILISSGIFGICHINHYLSTFNPIDLITIVYTFGLGIILGFIYEYGGSLLAAYIFHFLYNFLNQILFSFIILTNINYTTYYLVNIGVGVLIALYLLLIYLFILKKKEGISNDQTISE